MRFHRVMHVRLACKENYVAKHFGMTYARIDENYQSKNKSKQKKKLVHTFNVGYSIALRSDIVHKLFDETKIIKNKFSRRSNNKERKKKIAR